MRMETTRELDTRWQDLSIDQKKSALRQRREHFGPILRARLRQGDKIRATAARCGAREATFTFSHWEGGWLVSKSGISISPGQVYSVNGEVLR